MQKKSVTRRDFIKGAGLAVGAAVLAGCAPVVRPAAAPAGANAAPSKPAEPAVLDVWWNTDIPDLKALEGWKQDPENEFFKKNWNWGGLALAKFKPFLDKHPGVQLKISSHSWDSELRQNQLMSVRRKSCCTRLMSVSYRSPMSIATPNRDAAR